MKMVKLVHVCLLLKGIQDIESLDSRPSPTEENARAFTSSQLDADRIKRNDGLKFLHDQYISSPCLCVAPDATAGTLNILGRKVSHHLVEDTKIIRAQVSNLPGRSLARSLPRPDADLHRLDSNSKSAACRDTSRGRKGATQSGHK